MSYGKSEAVDNTMEVPSVQNERLQAAINRAQTEIQLFKAFLASESQRPSQGSKSARPVPMKSLRKPSNYARSGLVEVDTKSPELLERILLQLKWSRIIGVVLLLIITLAIVIDSNRNRQALLEQLLLSQLEITDPPDGANCNRDCIVRGRSPYYNLNHYLVVTSVGTQGINLYPIAVSDGALRSPLKVLENQSGEAITEDTEFTLRVLATSYQIATGGSSAFPDDAKLSKAIRLKLMPDQRVVIKEPVNGATVGIDGQVKGTTEFPNLNHYVVITSVDSGEAHVQEDQLVLRNGSFDGIFKTRKADWGKQFTVQVLATESTIPRGPLRIKPDDATLSNLVRVTRR